MTAKEYLEQIKRLDRMSENKLAEAARWEAIAKNTVGYSEGERVKSSGSLQKMTDAMDRCIDLRAEANRCFVRMDAIIAVIEQLKPDEYSLLYEVYVKYLTLKEAAYSLKITYSNATTIHGRALAHVEEILKKEKIV